VPKQLFILSQLIDIYQYLIFNGVDLNPPLHEAQKWAISILSYVWEIDVRLVHDSPDVTLKLRTPKAQFKGKL